MFVMIVNAVSHCVVPHCDVLCCAVLCCSVPQECLEAAGEWETLMAVCVCCGDFGALRSMAAGLKVRGAGGLTTV
jgi:hypothetical protein